MKKAIIWTIVVIVAVALVLVFLLIKNKPGGVENVFNKCNPQEINLGMQPYSYPQRNSFNGEEFIFTITESNKTAQTGGFIDENGNKIPSSPEITRGILYSYDVKNKSTKQIAVTDWTTLGTAHYPSGDYATSNSQRITGSAISQDNIAWATRRDSLETQLFIYNEENQTIKTIQTSNPIWQGPYFSYDGQKIGWIEQPTIVTDVAKPQFEVHIIDLGSDKMYRTEDDSQQMIINGGIPAPVTGFYMGKDFAIFGPDGFFGYYAVKYADLQVHKIETESKIYEGISLWENKLAYSAYEVSHKEGDQRVLTGKKGQIRIYDIETGKDSVVYEEPMGIPASWSVPFFSGTRVIWGTYESPRSDILQYSLNTGSKIKMAETALYDGLAVVAVTEDSILAQRTQSGDIPKLYLINC